MNDFSDNITLNHSLPTLEQLTGEQKKILALPPKGAVLIKGGAGAGKTLVATYRAIQLSKINADFFHANRTIIFTFNKDLSSYIGKLVRGHRELQVINIDKWVWFHFYRDSKRIDTQALRDFLVMARCEAFAGHADWAISRKSDDFYTAEIKWLKGRRIATLEEYQATKRTGRGTADRVTAKDKELLWKMFTRYNQLLTEAGTEDFDDRTNHALSLIENGAPCPRYANIVIDEAQDLSFAQIKLISNLVLPETKSITLVADTAQQIYQSGFSWADTGISVVGRSVELKHNYRNTRQIAEAAYSLLSHEEEKGDFTEMIPAATEGKKPLVIEGRADDCERDLRSALEEIPEGETVAVAYLTNHEVKTKKESLPGIGRGHITVTTFHGLKGLQFDHVFLWGVSEGNFPPRDSDESDISKSRKLLYVGMTRSSKTLTIYAPGTPSRFLSEIDREKIDRGRSEEELPPLPI